MEDVTPLVYGLDAAPYLRLCVGRSRDPSSRKRWLGLSNHLLPGESRATLGLGAS